MQAVLDGPACISPDALYVTDQAKAIMSMKNWAWNQFRRKSGLKQTRIGSKVYVRGADIIAAVERMSAGAAAE